MGTWGPGLWADDTAVDVRSSYREALEDGFADDEATSRILEMFASDVADMDAPGVVWLALGMAQSSVGRLTDRVRERAITVIDSGSDLARWNEADAKTRSKRAAVLDDVRDVLLGPQPDRKRIRKPTRVETTLVPGDVLAFTARSGRHHLLAVRAVLDTRDGTSPIVELLDYTGRAMPTSTMLSTLHSRPPTPQSASSDPAVPWKTVSGCVKHRRGKDFDDYGFRLAGKIDPPRKDVQEALVDAPTSYAGWDFWSTYLEREDEKHGERAHKAGMQAWIETRLWAEGSAVPGWSAIGVVDHGQQLPDAPIDVWTHEWHSLDETLFVNLPSEPGRTLDLPIYEVRTSAGATRFAARELSDDFWCFYGPA